MVGTLEKMLSDMDNGVFDFTENGKCSGCGQCCSNILPMTDKEIEVIKRYMRKKKIKEQVHASVIKNVDMDLTCPFLDNTKKKDKCTIYPARPYICRTFCCNKGSGRNDKKPRKNFKTVFVRETFFPQDEEISV